VARSGTIPRFYFHLRNDLDVPDEEGLDFPDIEAAREHAFKDARFASRKPRWNEGKINFEHSIDIEDEEGCVLDTVWFPDTVKVEG
jgi:hypothetical protein